MIVQLLQKYFLLFYPQSRFTSTTNSNAFDVGTMEGMAPQEKPAQLVNRIDCMDQQAEQEQSRGDSKQSPPPPFFFFFFFFFVLMGEWTQDLP